MENRANIIALTASELRVNNFKVKELSAGQMLLVEGVSDNLLVIAVGGIIKASGEKNIVKAKYINNGIVYLDNNYFLFEATTDCKLVINRFRGNFLNNITLKYNGATASQDSDVLRITSSLRLFLRAVDNLTARCVNDDVAHYVFMNELIRKIKTEYNSTQLYYFLSNVKNRSCESVESYMKKLSAMELNFF